MNNYVTHLLDLLLYFFTLLQTRLFHFSRNVFPHSQPNSLLSALCCHFTASPSVFMRLRCVEGRTINWVKGCWITAAVSGASPHPVLHDRGCGRLVILIGNSGSLACPVDGSLSRLLLQSRSSLCLTRQIWLFAFFFILKCFFRIFIGSVVCKISLPSQSIF